MSVNVEAKTQEIDGVKFTCVPFDAMRATKLTARLARLLGSAFGPLAYAVSRHAGELDEGSILPLAAAVIGPAFEKLDDDTTEALLLAILTGTSAVVGGRNVSISGTDEFNAVFTGRNPAVFKAVYFALAVNYAGFTDGSSKIVAAIKAAMGQSST